MNKKLRVLCSLISATMIGGMLNTATVKAATLSELDSIYANAYNATVNAMTVKTQKSVNEARGKIALIPKNLDWAIGEFSKQVDKIQHPIFVTAYEAIVKAQATPTQANINAAKAAIDPDMPIFYRGSYSTAVDVIQQGLMKNAVDAYNKAVESMLQEDIDEANKLFDEIKTAVDSSIVAWVDAVQNLGDNEELNDSGTHKFNYVISSETGTFGPEDSDNPTKIEGNIFLNETSGQAITLRNLNITGNLLINFGTGEVILENVTVDGVTVNNVGSHSLYVKGSSNVKALTVQDNNDDARIVVEGTATIANAKVLSGAKLEVAEGSTVGKVDIATKTPSKKVILSGNLNNVDVTSAGTIEVISGTVNLSSSTNVEVTVTTGIDAVVNKGEGTDSVVVAPSSTWDVKDLAGLKAALQNERVETINITADIKDIAEAIVVNREVTINGGDKVLTFTNVLNTLENGKRQGILVLSNGVEINGVTVTMSGEANKWQGVYGIQVYNSTDVMLNNVAVSGADGGILVNGSEVELTGVTTVSGNEFGGIEVSKGTSAELTNSTLTVTGTLVNASEEYGMPTIWLVNTQGTVTGTNAPTAINTTIKADQTQYYVTTGNEVAKPSTYKFAFEVPEGIVAGTEVTVPVTFATDVTKQTGYEKVRFEFSNEAVSTGNVTFKATDTTNTEYTFTNNGVWGPESGFPIAANYTVTQPWKVTFEKAGTYTITFKLVDKANNGAVIAEGTTEVVVGEQINQ